MKYKKPSADLIGVAPCLEWLHSQATMTPDNFTGLVKLQKMR